MNKELLIDVCLRFRTHHLTALLSATLPNLLPLSVHLLPMSESEAMDRCTWFLMSLSLKICFMPISHYQCLPSCLLYSDPDYFLMLLKSDYYWCNDSVVVATDVANEYCVRDAPDCTLPLARPQTIIHCYCYDSNTLDCIVPFQLINHVLAFANSTIACVVSFIQSAALIAIIVQQ